MAAVADHGHLAARPQAVGGQRRREHPQQVRAVQDHQGVAEAARQLFVVRTGQPAALAVPYAACGLDGAECPDSAGQTEHLERVQRVRPQGDAGADLSEFRGPFEHLDAPAPAMQGDGRRKPPDPAADDGRGALRHGSSLWVRGRRPRSSGRRSGARVACDATQVQLSSAHRNMSAGACQCGELHPVPLKKPRAATKPDRSRAVIDCSHVRLLGSAQKRAQPGRPRTAGQRAPRPHRRAGHPARGVRDRRKPQRAEDAVVVGSGRWWCRWSRWRPRRRGRSSRNRPDWMSRTRLWTGCPRRRSRRSWSRRGGRTRRRRPPRPASR